MSTPGGAARDASAGALSSRHAAAGSTHGRATAAAAAATAAAIAPSAAPAPAGSGSGVAAAAAAAGVAGPSVFCTAASCAS